MTPPRPTPLLYRWPQAARYGKPVPKTAFYERGAVKRSVRELFVAHIRRITWAYKLAPETINLPASRAAPEIEVFTLEVKTRYDDAPGDTRDLSTPPAKELESVLRAIDGSVPSPIIFEIAHGDAVQMLAAPKEIAGSKASVGRHLYSAWQPADAERVPLPTATSLAALYGALLEPLLPVARRSGERVSDLNARIEQQAKLERDIAKLEKKMRAEKQFNRQVELRHQLKRKQRELESLGVFGKDVGGFGYGEESASPVD